MAETRLWSRSSSRGWWKKRWSGVGREGLEGKQANVCQAGQRLELESLFPNPDDYVL